ncbi:MAG: cytochrome c oxidase accessory protein CcoG, partial [Saprospiraceae bacterium]|nr:cytochrome c oxidase accessory protein CcoG [Saprospiraceae bacterium]
VHVCPTGIDIRNGTQLECVNCTACIDACDEVMDKVSRPRGLIRYDSHNGIIEKRRRIFTPRVIAYTIFLAILLGLNFAFLGSRTEVEAIILRTPGLMYQKVDEQHISNLYNYEVVNKTTSDLPLEFKAITDGAEIKLVGQGPTAKAGDIAKGSFFIIMDKSKTDGRKNDVVIEVISNGKVVDKVTTNFFAPPN